MRYFYASDDNYAKLTAVSAVSLLLRNPGADVTVLGYGLSDASAHIIRGQVEKFGGVFHLIDVSPLIAKLERQGAAAYTSYAIYSRLFIPELLPEAHGRALYLDCDTLVVDSLCELDRIDLGGRPLALGLDAVHRSYKRYIGLRLDEPYYNTGVFLMDLDVWRDRHCTERLMDELAHPTGKIALPDQDIIARALKGEVQALSPRWNFLSQFVLFGCREKPAVYHFSGQTLGRPWHACSKHPARDAYRQVAIAAGVPEVMDEPRRMKIEYKLQYWLWKLLPGWLFRPTCNLMYRYFIWLYYRV